MFIGRHLPLSLLILIFLPLALLYAYSVPIFESPDELYHFGMIHHLAEARQLPVQVPGQLTIYQQEGSQPPLYYLLGAALVSPIARDDFLALRRFNPHGVLGVPGVEGNKNRMLHPQVYPPDLHGTTLAVYVVRLFSIMLGAVTVCAVYAAARVLLPGCQAAALLAAGLTAFNPQFLFISASVNNDTLVTALNSVVIWRMLVLLRDGFRVRDSLLLAVLIALATLSKLSGLVLVPVVALAGGYVAVRDRDWRGLVQLGAAMVTAWVLLAGWWYLRNLILYDELFGTQRMLDTYGRRMPLGFGAWLGTMAREFTGLRRSYWGVFGWFSIETLPVFYAVMDVMSLLAAAGFVAYLWRIRADRAKGVQVMFVCLALTLGFGSFLGWTTQVEATQGRLLFPYVACSSPLLALGISELARLTGRRSPAGLIVPLGVFAAAVPFITLMPEYAPPPRLTVLPAEATPVDAQFGVIRLLGFETPDRRYAPGESIPITLYWQPAAQTVEDYSLALEVFLPDGVVIGKLDTYPGWGSLQTSRWQPGVIYADTVRVPLMPQAEGMGVLRVKIGWWIYPVGAALAPTRRDGTPLAGVDVAAGAFASADTAPDLALFQPAAAPDFGGVFRLLGHRWDGEMLLLAWQATAAPDADYTVFVQALDEGFGVLAAQGDAPPALPTRYLRRGERFITHHTLMPARPPRAGEYPLVIGWYSATRRLATSAPGDAYPLMQVRLP